MPQSSSSRNPQRSTKRRNSSELANDLRKIRRRSAIIIDLTDSSPGLDGDHQTDDSHEPITPPPRTSALGVHAVLTELAQVSQQLEKEDRDRSDLQNKYDRVIKDLKEANAALNALRLVLVDQTIDTSAGHCNNCATKFDFDNALESPYILDGCGAGTQFAELA
ncbi:hypothetical protein PtrSN002B_007985 [Pyrenophora tritici-repentis]|uniref:Uncharacterized protein n=1 Tax=Pyrenophora tritici-repentis (strain Pt-1C-BFP) TaxID=426418 RepID=B2W5K7_PYRTR|nr:uncharacterized protein PTRG_04907 [Pyrenophora tritici-repentis Pt-1C-BFP]KAG9382768.1 hypothetical protein A1F94_006689 [Pyrenophora tritici-repentis]EDU47814.1 predicted protein [Pyrenophora tritici-repentis Pt-1C-BFP]KAI0626742.1 hypothetical protein TUN199_01296 [Pyrenophora tritici-repentis]KAI1533009.1 hypothetical protein PtrSN001C_007764 [Pyrenophora tritici-repentis]KAI1543036.1 hypothetical protein PtrSN002B_007985 [Pyrenophora tritici-repentis]